MKKAFPIVVLSVSLAMCQGGVTMAANPEAEKAALASAKQWLELVDKGQYQQSWTQSSKYFQTNVSSNQWVKQVAGVRQPFGKVISRNLKTSQYATTLPGAPDGEYVVLQFDTSFANKATAVETITPMKEKNGDWRVSGYFVK